MMYYLKIIVYLLYLNNMEHGKSSPGHHISFEILYLDSGDREQGTLCYPYLISLFPMAYLVLD